MKIETYSFPRSSFLAVEKDMELLVNLFLKNERLKKLLYYDTPTALSQPNVPQDKSLEMFGKQIKIVPKLKVDGDFGKATEIRLKLFQKTEKLEQDGVYGKQTKNKFSSYLKTKKKTNN